MPHKCPECGAILLNKTSCQAIFESFLALEFTDPQYGRVHFLTVTCFMVQHGRYSDEALAWIEPHLRTVLEGEVTSRQIVQKMNRVLGQGHRSWKVNRRPGEPPLLKIPWSMTIADVAVNHHDAHSYCARVEQWAYATLHEMQPLLPKR
jgi:Family of unknown function (DUF5946)